MVKFDKKEYGRKANAIAKILRAKRALELKERHVGAVLSIPPTKDNFIGNDEYNPKVCNHFGCSRKLSPTEQLFGHTCIHHQSNQKIDPTLFVSHPIKQTA